MKRPHEHRWRNVSGKRTRRVQCETCLVYGTQNHDWTITVDAPPAPPAPKGKGVREPYTAEEFRTLVKETSK